MRSKASAHGATVVEACGSVLALDRLAAQPVVGARLLGNAAGNKKILDLVVHLALEHLGM